MITHTSAAGAVTIAYTTNILHSTLTIASTTGGVIASANSTGIILSTSIPITTQAGVVASANITGVHYQAREGDSITSEARGAISIADSAHINFANTACAVSTPAYSAVVRFSNIPAFDNDIQHSRARLPIVSAILGPIYNFQGIVVFIWNKRAIEYDGGSYFYCLSRRDSLVIGRR
jgi:hypothetical protein